MNRSRGSRAISQWTINSRDSGIADVIPLKHEFFTFMKQANHNWKLASLAAMCLALLNGIAYGQKVNSSKIILQGVGEFRSAFVRVEPVKMPGRSVKDGIVVTPEGHVLISERSSPNHRAGDPLKFQLSDGRVVWGKALGWSDEWSITMAKISNEGALDHVQLCPSEEIKVGLTCISLGKLRVLDPTDEPIDHSLISFGKVRRVAQDRWLTSTCPMNFHNGVFDYQGRLLGITSEIQVGSEDTVQTHVAVIKELWDDLVAGKNIDKARALSLINEREDGLATGRASKEQGTIKSDAIQIAKRTTVRIRPKNDHGGWDDPGWSGIVVTAQGHIATCGHHDRMPGEEVTVHFSDGKVAAGKILGTNRVTDIGIVKITDDGDWPFAKLGLSQTVPSDSPCIFAGYPASYKGEEPIVRKGNIAIPEDYVWNRHIYASGIETKGGDSGGGLFDEDGVLIATHEGGERYTRSEFFHLQWKALTSGMPIDVDRTWANPDLINVVSLKHRFEPENNLVRWRWKVMLPDSPKFVLHYEASSDTPDSAPKSPGTLDSAGVQLPGGEFELDLTLTLADDKSCNLIISAAGIETVIDLEDCDIFAKSKFLRKTAGTAEIESKAPSTPFLLAMIREHASTGPATPTGGLRIWLEPTSK